MVPPAVNCRAICLLGVTSMTRLLLSSAIRMLPFRSNSPLLGLLSWLGPFPGTPVAPYCQMIRWRKLTMMMRWLAWSAMRTSGPWRPGKKKQRLRGRVHLVGAGARDARLAVLPEDGSVVVDDHHAVVWAAVDGIRTAGQRWVAGWDTGAGNEGELAEAPGIVDADHGVEAGLAGAELPDDGVGAAVDFDDTVVELIRDQDGAVVVRVVCVPSKQMGTSREGGQGAKREC